MQSLLLFGLGLVCDGMKVPPKAELHMWMFVVSIGNSVVVGRLEN